MTITVHLPDAVGDLLFAGKEESSRAVLEAIALEGYRTERLTESDVRQLLGFETRMEVHEFLKQHGAFMHYTLEDLKHDGAVAANTAERVQNRRQTDANQPLNDRRS